MSTCPQRKVAPHPLNLGSSITHAQLLPAGSPQHMRPVLEPSRNGADSLRKSADSSSAPSSGRSPNRGTSPGRADRNGEQELRRNTLCGRLQHWLV